MSAPTLSELSAQIDELKAVIGYLNRSLSELRYENDVDAENLNIAWILITGFFIFFMQAGFTLVEVGGVRLLNSTVVLLKKAVTICIGAVAFWLVGFGFAYGTGNPFIGTTYFALHGIEESNTVNYTSWFFQWTFSLTSSTIVSGSLLERTRLRAYLVCTFITSAWIYPVVAHWIWATDGWLTANKPVSELFYANGVLDFAGCGVVHMVGGIIALVGAIVVGARMERFEPKRKNEFVPHNSAFMTLGTFILWFSWYGFNSGSILRLNQGGSEIASKVVLNTSLSAAIAGCASLFQARLILKEYNLPVTLNGILTGLVSITASCAFVQPWSAIVIGIVGSVIHFWGAKLLIKLKVDDPLEASVVHFFGGSWGLIATGLFAVSEKIEAVYQRPAVGGGGLFTEGTGYQLAMQLLAFAVILGWTAFWSCILFYVLRALDSLRISSAAERTMLLDIHHAGVAAMNPLTTPANRNRPDVVVFDDESEVVLEPSTNHTRHERGARESRDTSRPSHSIERSVESSSDTPSSSNSDVSDGEGHQSEAMEVFEPSRHYVLDRHARNNNIRGTSTTNNTNQQAPVIVEVSDSSDSSDDRPRATTTGHNNNNNLLDSEDDPIIDPMLLHQRMSLDNMQRSDPSPPHSDPSIEVSASEDSSSEAHRHIAMIRDGTSTYNTILNNKRNKRQKKT